MGKDWWDNSFKSGRFVWVRDVFKSVSWIIVRGRTFLGRCFRGLIERKLLNNLKLIILPKVFAFCGVEFQRKKLLGLALVKSLKQLGSGLFFELKVSF